MSYLGIIVLGYMFNIFFFFLILILITIDHFIINLFRNNTEVLIKEAALSVSFKKLKETKNKFNNINKIPYIQRDLAILFPFAIFLIFIQYFYYFIIGKLLDFQIIDVSNRIIELENKFDKLYS